MRTSLYLSLSLSRSLPPSFKHAILEEPDVECFKADVGVKKMKKTKKKANNNKDNACYLFVNSPSSPSTDGAHLIKCYPWSILYKIIVHTFLLLYFHVLHVFV